MTNLDPNDLPELSWWKRIFRSRSLLQYWLGKELRQAWVMRFEEKSDNCIIYQDYVTKKVTVVKSNHPITYTLTEIK
jgi:hypothetical protein